MPLSNRKFPFQEFWSDIYFNIVFWKQHYLLTHPIFSCKGELGYNIRWNYLRCLWLTPTVGLFLPLGNGITTNISVTNDTSSSETKGTGQQEKPHVVINRRNHIFVAQFTAQWQLSIVTQWLRTNIPVNNCSNLIMQWNPNESQHRAVDFLTQF